MATPQQIASQAGSANTAYQMQAARQAYGRKRKPKQAAQQENQALNGFQTTRRQRLENQAVAGFGDTYRVRKTELTGRARRKKGGNYTSYGQTGGALAPSGGGKGRAQVGNSHGVAIVRGDGVFGGGGITPGMLGEGPGARKPKLPGYLTELTTAREKVSSRPFSRRHKGNPRHGSDGPYVAPRKKGRKRGRPQYTNGTGAINPKTGNRLYF